MSAVGGYFGAKSVLDYKVANRVLQSTLATLNDWLNPFHDFTRINKTLSRLVTTVWAFIQHSAKQQTRVAAHRPVNFILTPIYSLVFVGTSFKYE